MHQLKPIAVLSPGEVYGAVWSPDGKMLAVYGRKGVWLYTLNDLCSPRFFQSDTEIVNVVFSPHGKYFASEDYLRTDTAEFSGVQLWDISSGYSQAFLTNVFSPVFIADSSTLLVQDMDYYAPRLLFWDTEYINEIGFHNTPKGQYRLALPDVYLTVANPSGEIIACAEARQNSSIVSLRNAKTGQLIKVLDSRSQTISKMMFDPSGKLLAVVGKYGLMKVWNIASGELRYIVGTDVSNWEGRDDFQFSVSFSFDSSLVSLASIPLGHQALADIWTVTNGKRLDGFLTDYASSIYFTDTTFIVVDDYRSDRTYLRGTASSIDPEPLLFTIHPKFNPARTIIASYSRDNRIILFAVS